MDDLVFVLLFVAVGFTWGWIVRDCQADNEWWRDHE